LVRRQLFDNPFTQIVDPIDAITSKVGGLTSGIGEPIGELTSAVGALTSVIVSAGQEFASKLEEEVTELFEEIMEGLDVGWEADFNLEFNWPREERRVPAEALQNLGLTPKIALLDSVATGSLDFGFAIKFNIGMQLEVFTQEGFEAFCPFWIVPVPPYLVAGGCELSSPRRTSYEGWTMVP
jgi:hypothetical protein